MTMQDSNRIIKETVAARYLRRDKAELVREGINLAFEHLGLEEKFADLVINRLVTEKVAGPNKWDVVIYRSETLQSQPQN